MIRMALLSLLPQAGSLSLKAQSKKNGDSPLLKVGLEDPFTKKDPKLMKSLGVVDDGPLVWADTKRTADIEKVLGEGRVLWMATGYCKIGFTSAFCGVCLLAMKSQCFT